LKEKKECSTNWQENRLLIIIPEVRKCPTEGGADATSICLGMAEMLRGNFFRNVILRGNDPDCNTSRKIMLLKTKNSVTAAWENERNKG
jgi:hypothetical protein